MPVDPSFSHTQSGNVFFALFGAVGLVGVIGAASMTILKGPVAGMQKVTKYTVAENAMIAAGRLSIVAANADCDDDGVNEPLEWADAGAEPAPSGGGLIPSAIGAAKQDPWGNTYGYCVWDHGAAIDNAGCGGASQNRLAGDADIESDAGGIVIALISSGPDRVFQTSCGDDPDYVTKPSGSDDIVLTYTYGEASDLAGGLWQPKGDETAEIARDLEVYSAADPNTQIFGLDSASDPTKPSIKVDFIQKLSAGASGVTFLSDLLVDGGKVGIGTTSPSTKLHVKGGDLRVQDSSYTRVEWFNDSDVIDPADYWIAEHNNSGALLFMRRDTSAGTWGNNLSLLANGNVGIGTTTPSHQLHVLNGGRLGGLQIGQTDGSGTSVDMAYPYESMGTHNPGHNLRIQSGKGVYFHTGMGTSEPDNNSKVRMVIDPTGNVGIGTTSPTRPLHVVGAWDMAMLESTGSFSSLRFKANSTGASKDLVLHYGGNSAVQQNQLHFGRYAYDGGAWEVTPVTFDMDAPNSSLIVREDGWIQIGNATEGHGLSVNDNSTKHSQVVVTNNNAMGRAGFMARYGANAGFVLQQTSDGIGILENHAGHIYHYAKGVGTHRFITTDSYLTRFTIENDERLNAHSNRIINLATPTAASDAATKAYVDTTAADAAAAAADNLGNHTATQNLNMGSNRIVSLAGPSAGTDAATKAYVDLTAASAASAAADNLGNHTATQTLVMGAYGISSSAGVIRDGNGGWVRTYGNTGWYNGTHQGGWYMIDTDWLRAYNNKNIITGGVMRADGGFNVDGFQTINANGSELQLRNTTASGFTSIRMDGADSTKTLRLHYGGSSDNTLRFGSYADNFSATWNGNPVIFDLDAPTDSLRVHDNGNVGIGLAAPTARLHVAGTGKFTGALDMTSQKITNLANPTAAQDAATKAYVDANVGGSGLNFSIAGSSNLSSPGTSPTFASVPIGAPAADRYILVAIVGGITGNAYQAFEVTSVSVGGVAATNIYTPATQGRLGSAFWMAHVPTGTTANIAVTMTNAVSNLTVATYRLTGLTTGNVQSTFAGIPYATTEASTTLKVPKDGAAVFTGYCQGAAPLISWSGATEDVDYGMTSIASYTSSMFELSKAVTMSVSQICGGFGHIAGVSIQ